MQIIILESILWKKKRRKSLTKKPSLEPEEDLEEEEFKKEEDESTEYDLGNSSESDGDGSGEEEEPETCALDQAKTWPTIMFTLKTLAVPKTPTTTK